MKSRIGLAVAFAIAVALQAFLDDGSPSGIIEPWSVPARKWQLLPLITGLSVVAPGVLIGLCAGKRGILLGALVGYAGAMIGSPLWSGGFVTVSDTLGSALLVSLSALGHTVICAAGGAAGQLMRRQ